MFFDNSPEENDGGPDQERMNFLCLILSNTTRSLRNVLDELEWEYSADIEAAVDERIAQCDACDSWVPVEQAPAHSFSFGLCRMCLKCSEPRFEQFVCPACQSGHSHSMFLSGVRFGERICSGCGSCYNQTDSDFLRSCGVLDNAKMPSVVVHLPTTLLPMEYNELCFGEDDVRLLKEMGIAADKEDHWSERAAEMAANGKRGFINPRTGETTGLR